MANKGRIRLDAILWVYLPLMLLLPCYTYYMGVVYEKKVDPWSTVTDTACPYPQNILFRFGMLTASSLLSLIYFALFRWLAYEQRRIDFPMRTPSYMYYLSQFSIFTFTLAIGTIDSSDDIGPIHTPASIIFFVIMFGLTVRVTYTLGEMRKWDSSVMTASSWFWKKVTCGYLSAVWLFCLIGVLSQQKSNKQGRYIVGLEWNEVFVNLLWIFSFRSDWKKVYLCVTGMTSSEGSLQSLQSQPAMVII